MNPDMERFLNLEATPARVTIEQASWLLGFAPHEIPILMAKGLLKPLGHPAHNGQKFFSTLAAQNPSPTQTQRRARLLGTNVARVYLAKHRLSKMLRETIGEFEQAESGL